VITVYYNPVTIAERANPRPSRFMSRDDATTAIQVWLDRLRAGDDSAREALIVAAAERLSRLARKMLRDFPVVRRWEETDDVLQNALLRLDRSLRSVRPPTPRDFFRLAAAQIRRELIDLARSYSGPEGLGANHQSQRVVEAGTAKEAPGVEKSDLTHEPSRLAAWGEFHGQVEALSKEDRELFDLLWYQGLTQVEAANVLGVSEKTVNKRWVAARLRLGLALGGQLPF
jgi:RNA polymerase sigma-70 factor (ECF subfamily)